MDRYGVDFEKIFFLYFLKNPVLLDKIYEGFFKNPDIDILAKVSKQFMIKFSETPSKEQLKILIKDIKSKRQLDDDIVEAIFQTDIKEYDEDWLKRTTEAWVKWQYFDKKLISVVEYVKLQEVSPDNVENVVNHAISILNQGSLSFDEKFGLDFFSPEDHLQLEGQKIQSGLSFVDRLTNGGYDPKALVVYAGEQNVGKSIWMANDAANFVRLGYNTVYITAEMSAVKVLKRIGANLLGIAMSEYSIKSADRDFMKRRLERISNGLLPPGKLFVKEFPTSQATVPDIENYLKTLEEKQGFKLKAIIIDYINILANYRNANSDNTYLKIKQIAEDLRAMAVRNDWLIITATQLTRGAWDASEVTMQNIAESAGLAHTADMMYAIIQDQMMHAAKEYWLKVLKIRDGEGKGTKCRFTIDYNHMKLSETSDIITNQS
jgi:KaiC/GvpD/RAD55 family RecA-like ATPase